MQRNISYLFKSRYAATIIFALMIIIILVHSTGTFL